MNFGNRVVTRREPVCKLMKHRPEFPVAESLCITMEFNCLLDGVIVSEEIDLL